MFWRAKKPKYRVVYYGPYWNYVVEQFSFGIFGWRWRPIKVADPSAWQSDGTMYLHGDTADEVLQKLRAHIVEKNREKNQAAARQSFARACREAKKTVVLDEFTLE